MKPDTLESMQYLVERAKRRGEIWVPREIIAAALESGLARCLGPGYDPRDSYGNKRRAAQRECMARLRAHRKVTG